MVNWVGLALPFVYLGILVGSLATFSSLYRKRKASKAASLAPWFGPHVQRNVYLSLLHLDPDSGSPKVPESILKAALLRRATEDIHRILAVRNSKQALSTLLQRGSVGDDLWQRFLRAEKEIEEELRDVVNEANAFAPNWGQVIFQSANEMANNQLVRKRMDELQAQAKVDREWWDQKRAAIQAEFMKELDEDAPANSGKGLNPLTSRGSDDDAVLVESGGPAVPQQSGGKKKKKGKN
ncbi:translocation protein [Trichodelitschia bisporula]|uniref:Translocation protein n=1 Tax=Trichodelitschia bisporula TaxID=703511 RepID=A0A6G1I6M7_9PEZI|nr:translocation protein [Trichodelitschia bisporula]